MPLVLLLDDGDGELVGWLDGWGQKCIFANKRAGKPAEQSRHKDMSLLLFVWCNQFRVRVVVFIVCMPVCMPVCMSIYCQFYLLCLTAMPLLPSVPCNMNKVTHKNASVYLFLPCLLASQCSDNFPQMCH